MFDAIKAVPGIPDGDPSRALAAIREGMQVLSGQRGERLDRAVTFRDLVDLGLIDAAVLDTLFKVAVNAAVVSNMDPRLSDARTPVAHTHTLDDVTGVDLDLGIWDVGGEISYT